MPAGYVVCIRRANRAKPRVKAKLHVNGLTQHQEALDFVPHAEPDEEARARGLISVCAGQSLCGAPRRNRTGDPILTMDVRVVHDPSQDLTCHTTTLVRGNVEGRVVRRREVTCSAVSGKSLARAPCVIVIGTNAGAIVSAALDRLRLGTSGALLS